MYLALDKNSKYNHRKALATIKTNRSDIKPVRNTFTISPKEKLDCVIGWKSKIIRRKKLANRNKNNKLANGARFENIQSLIKKIKLMPFKIELV